MRSAGPTRLGKYELVARIAKGGMAEIFLARQRGLIGFSRLVVVKRILPHLAEEPCFVEMFLEEARLAASINHPNVVQIFDVDCQEGSYYIAMEYIPGISLGHISRQLRRSGTPMPFAVAGEIVAQTCDGLHAAHEMVDERGRTLHLVHRDLSPHNLMIGEGGQVKLVDFGIAKARGSAIRTVTGKVKGKYPYLSPEQCLGLELDRRSDLFSLGAVFFELLAGRRLFERGTDHLTLKAITEDPIPALRELPGEVPEAIDEIVQRCLRRDPAERFASAAQLGAAVRETLARLGQPTTPATLAGHLGVAHRELLDARAALYWRASRLRQGRGELSVPVLHEVGSGEDSAAATATPATRAPPRLRRRRLVGRTRVIVGLLLLFLFLLGLSAGVGYRWVQPAAPLVGPPLRFGVPPSLPASLVRQELEPLVRYLERRLGRPVTIAVTGDYRALRRGLVRGEIDFALLPALELVLARADDGRLRVLADLLYEGARTYQSILIVRDDSAIRSPADLRGQRFCYVDRESTSGFLVPRAYLRRQGLDPDQLFTSVRFSGNHLAVMRDILSGRCAGGAIWTGAMTGGQSRLATSRVRLLAIAGEIPFDALCGAPQLAPVVADALRAALLAMRPERDIGNPIIGATLRISGFVAPRPRAFEPIAAAARQEGLLR